MDPMAEHSLEVETRVEASAETIFAYFTDLEKYRKWKGRGAELDPRPGGTYRVRMPGENTVVGRYIDLEPPHRIVFTWGWEGSEDVPPGSTRVEVTLVPDGDATIVRLRHTGFPSDESRAQHQEGWVHYLSRLSEAAAGRDPGPDPLDRA